MAKEDYKSLKIFVYVMGIILVGGILVISFSIFNFFNHDITQRCSPINLQISQKILNATLEKDKLTLLLTPDGHQQTILVVDYCNGIILNRIDFEISGH